MPYNYEAPFEIRDIRNGEWYWVQKEVLTSKKINASDKLVYSALAYFANNKTQIAYPSVRGIADLVGIHRNTVVKSIKALILNKFISAKKKEGHKSYYELLKITVTNFVTPPELSQIKTPTVTNKELVTVTNGNTNNTYIKQDLINNILSKDNTEKSEIYGNSDINEIISSFKKKLNLTELDGSITQNRQFAHLLLKKLKTKDEVLKVIDLASKNQFWAPKLTSMTKLYYKAVEISREGMGNKQFEMEDIKKYEKFR